MDTFTQRLVLSEWIRISGRSVLIVPAYHIELTPSGDESVFINKFYIDHSYSDTNSSDKK